MRQVLTAGLGIVLVLAGAQAQPVVDYDIVYVRVPRGGDTVQSFWADVDHPTRCEPDSDLVVLHPDGSETVLIDMPATDAAMDPSPSFDGQRVYFAHLKGCDGDHTADAAEIAVVDVATHAVTYLTHGEGLNLGPSEIAGGRVLFTSSRNGFHPIKGRTSHNMQIFAMDLDGRNVEQWGYLNLESALHPMPLADGRCMWATNEAQGLRSAINWAAWVSWCDGRKWGPLFSQFTSNRTIHFLTQKSNGNIVGVWYYPGSNAGFGTFVEFPSRPVQVDRPPFNTPNPFDPVNSNGDVRRLRFSPPGWFNPTPFAISQDVGSKRDADGNWLGKVTQPAGVPQNNILLVYSPGPATNRVNLPRGTTAPEPWYDGGIYLLPDGVIATHPDQLILVKNDPNYNEQQPRALVPYRDIYGIDAPPNLGWVPNDGTVTANLPAGTPYGEIGTSSFYLRNTTPGESLRANAPYDGLGAFNGNVNPGSGNWFLQGADAGKYDNSDIQSVRIVAQQPNTVRSAVEQFMNFADERLYVWGEIPLRKTKNGQTVMDIQGNPDMSFLAKVLANVPFTFQTLNDKGMVLNMAQTWHMVRPGETYASCGGCHAHAEIGLGFETTAAAQPDYQVADLTQTVVQVPEFERDIRPILEAQCASCHVGPEETAPARLVLADFSPYPNANGYPLAYHILAHNDENPGSKWGIPPAQGPVDDPTRRKWVLGNASRYMRKFQSRRSLLMWKLWGERLDGWTDDDFPSEVDAGDPTSIPDGADVRMVDLDLNPDAPGYVDHTPFTTVEERKTIAAWIDLGAPIGAGMFEDVLPPTLTVTARDHFDGVLRVGVADHISGVNASTLSVVADQDVNGIPAGQELIGQFSAPVDAVRTLDVTSLAAGTSVTVRVSDNAGNEARLVRTFGDVITPPPPEVCGDGIDNDGDGQIDEDCPVEPTPICVTIAGHEICGTPPFDGSVSLPVHVEEQD